MKPVRDDQGVIINAAALQSSQVAMKRVLCPGCGHKVFDTWPGGWDAHAEHRCEGLERKNGRERKVEFKAAFRYLFGA